MLRKEDIRKLKTRTSRGGQQKRSITKEKKRLFGHSNKNKFVDTNFND